MRIDLTSIMVDDQDKAERFYTEVLGFIKKMDFPVGEFRWITFVSPEAPDGVQLALEPNANPVGKAFQQGLYEQGIPATSFGVDDVQQEYERLKALGVRFTAEPSSEGTVATAIFDDTCGNLIQIHQVEG
jgi:catechol 2,3-dioxygenase-like lactoylglutathione lyase family enzyme